MGPLCSYGFAGLYAVVKLDCFMTVFSVHLQGGSPVTDLGQLLMGFFRRYGSYFNLYTDAVAIGSGGICPKKSVCQSLQDILAPRLCVQDISTLRYAFVTNVALHLATLSPSGP